MPSIAPSVSPAPRGGQPGPLAWAGILALTGAAGLLGLGVFSLFQAARSAEETARLEAGRAASVTARALRAALTAPHVLELLGPQVRFAVAGGRIVVPREVGWIDAPLEAALPDALSTQARNAIAAARRAEFVEGDRIRALELLTSLSGDETLPAPHRSWILVAAANCAQRASEIEARDALLEALVRSIEETSDERPRDDVTCGVLVLCSRSLRPIPTWFAKVFARVQPEMGHTALERAAAVDTSSSGESLGHGPELAVLKQALTKVAARRERLRRVRELLPSLRSSTSEARAVGKDVLFFFRRGAASGEGALIDASSLGGLLDRERVRSPGPLDTVGTAGTLLHGREVASAPHVFPVIPPLLGIAPTEPAPGGGGPHWPLIVSVVALTIFLLVGIAAALRAMRKEQLHTRARADFLTAVTHELKTPLASIRLLVDVLSDPRADHEKHSRYLERLTGEAARLTMLVENVLDLGRIERSERSYDRRRADLTEIVEEAALLYRPLAAREDMELVVELGREPATASVDRGAITQVLLNLFENARRYARQGRRIEVTAARTAGSFRLQVHDHGPGVPEEEREAIFARFRRGRSAPQAANPGVGLGLFLARAIARDHGGDLRSVAPKDGRGATFELTLPVEGELPEDGQSGEGPPEQHRVGEPPRAPSKGSVTS